MGAKAPFLMSPKLMIGKMCPDKKMAVMFQSFLDEFERFIKNPFNECSLM